MSVRKRKWVDAKGSQRESWTVHVKHTDPSGRVLEVRKTSPIQTRRGAEQYEREIRRALVDGSLTTGKVQRRRPATVAEFAEVFLTEHAREAGLRPDSVRWQRRTLTSHVVPHVGKIRADEVRSHHFGDVKRAMLAKRDYSPKTVNNVLAVFASLVRYWYEREGIDAPSLRIGLMRTDEPEPKVCSRADYARMVVAAEQLDAEVLAIVLLMGDAGLRQSEVRGLKVGDLWWAAPAAVRIQRSLSREQEDQAPKGRRPRTVPMTPRLHDALREHANGRPRFPLAWMFEREDGGPFTHSCVQVRLERVEVAAGIVATGASHHLRHLFVTELAAANVPPRVIQELAGHRDLRTTLRYMHLQEGQTHAAIGELARRNAGAHTEHTKVRNLRDPPRTGRNRRSKK